MRIRVSSWLVKSASTTRTRFPLNAAANAVLATTVVLPAEMSADVTTTVWKAAAARFRAVALHRNRCRDKSERLRRNACREPRQREDSCESRSSRKLGTSEMSGLPSALSGSDLEPKRRLPRDSGKAIADPTIAPNRKPPAPVRRGSKARR